MPTCVPPKAMTQGTGAALFSRRLREGLQGRPEEEPTMAKGQDKPKKSGSNKPKLTTKEKKEKKKAKAAKK